MTHGDLNMKPVFQQAGKFIGSGFLGTTAHYAILASLVKNTQVNPVRASSVGMLSGAVIIYFINYHITFHSSKNHVGVLNRFLPMVGAGFVLNWFIITLCMNYLSLPLAVSQPIATIGQFLFNFSISRIWIF